MRSKGLLLAGVPTGLCFLFSSVAAAVGFYGVGTSLDGTVGSSVCWDVSPNGQTVVGRFKDSQSPDYQEEGFVWTLQGGMVGLGSLPGDAFMTEATASSNAGEVVVGRGTGSWNQYHAVYATTTGVVDLEDPTEYYTRSSAADVSSDGTVIVGFSEETGTRAFRWTAATGMVFLADAWSAARGVSADGSTVVGTAGSEAFRWTDETGTVGLGFFPDESSSWAVDVSTDGTVVVGSAHRHLPHTTSTLTEAFVWTEQTGMVGLGPFSEDSNKVLLSDAKGVSGDGKLIVGLTTTSTGDDVPFIWDADHGMRLLEDFLVDQCSLDLSDWDLRRVTGISEDGLTIVGYGYGPSGQQEGWVAVIPEPTTLSLLALGGLALMRRRWK